MAQQTAVEWLQNELLRLEMLDGYGMFEIFEKAKAMEKGQIINAYEIGFSNGIDKLICSDGPKIKNAEQYYNETYGS